MRLKTMVLAIVVTWFLVGGIAHFLAPRPFLSIVPPGLPFRIEAVYISGFFELLGAFGMAVRKLRKAAGYGLMALTVAVTPANVYMWTHPTLFPGIPASLLAWRLALQVLLLAAIWWAAQPDRARASLTSR